MAGDFSPPLGYPMVAICDTLQGSLPSEEKTAAFPTQEALQIHTELAHTMGHVGEPYHHHHRILLTLHHLFVFPPPLLLPPRW